MPISSVHGLQSCNSNKHVLVQGPQPGVDGNKATHEDTEGEQGEEEVRVHAAASDGRWVDDVLDDVGEDGILHLHTKGLNHLVH